jgi:peptide deformylase
LTVLALVPASDPILRTPTPFFNFENPPTDPIQLARDLADTMVEKKGYGLAAPQVGLPYRVFAMGFQGGEVHVCFNPRIVEQSVQRVKMNEGCLSYPGIVLEIERSAAIKVRYFQPNGEFVTKEFGGLTARVVQHELDHLDGKLFTDYVSRLKLDIAKRKARKKFHGNPGKS